MYYVKCRTHFHKSLQFPGIARYFALYLPVFSFSVLLNKQPSLVANAAFFACVKMFLTSVRKDHPYAKMVVSSPLMPWITLDIEADLKQQDKEYNLVIIHSSKQPVHF